MSKLKLDNSVVAKNHPDTGLIITAGTKNPEWGSIRVESMAIVNNGNGLVTIQKRVAFVRMRLDDAQMLIDAKLLADGKPLPIEGRIIVQESLEPFYEGQEPKINPTTKEEVLFSGLPVFRQAIFVSDESSKDILIQDYVKGQMVVETVGEDVPVEQTVE